MKWNIVVAASCKGAAFFVSKVKKAGVILKK